MSYPPPRPGEQYPYQQNPHQQPTEPSYPPPPPPGYGPPPPMPPRPPGRRKGMHPMAIVGIVVAAVVVLCGVVGIVASLGSDEQPDSTANEQPEPAAASGEPAGENSEKPKKEEEPEPEPPAAGIGDPVRDGQFEFTVTSMETGIGSVGDQYFGKEAQGQFVFIHVTVENVGDEAQYFDSSSQYLLDTKDREHSADGEAAIYVEDSESFLNEINPGNSVNGIVIFDIPADAKPATVRLHDSPFSGGAAVALGGGGR